MRVLLVCNQFPKASESFIAAKVMGLVRRGWDVHVACSRSDPGQWELFAHVLDQRLLDGRVHPGGDVVDLAADLSPALVHFEFGHFARGRIGAAAATGARTIVSFRGNDVNANGLEDADFFGEVWAHADALHVLTDRLWRRALARGCDPSTPYAVIPPAVDTALFDPGPPAHPPAADLAGRPLRLLSVGRLHWMKGHVYALHALRRLLDRGLRCELQIVGSQDYAEGRLEVLFTIHDLGLEANVALLDAQPQTVVRERMRWADVLVHAAVSEGFCNSVLEAQAMAVPVVGTDCLEENVVHGETGFLVPPRDPHAIADRVAALADDVELRHSIGRAGRRRALMKFRADRQLARFDALYRRVAARPRRNPAKPRDQLAARLERRLAELERLRAEHRHLSRAARREDDLALTWRTVDSVVPNDAIVAIASRGDEGLLDLPVAAAWHFPQSEQDGYAGRHPANSREAIAQLEALRSRGAQYLVVPETASWMLGSYRGFREHLERRYRAATRAESGCAVFELSEAQR